MTGVIRPIPPKLPRPTPAPIARSRIIDLLEADIAANPDQRTQLVESLWASYRGPLVEPVGETESVVTFVWRDAVAQQVLLFVNRLTDERDLAPSMMVKVPGTDLWHLSYRMSNDWRASYAFLPHTGEGQPSWGGDDQRGLRLALDLGQQDPRNAVTVRNRAGVRMSVVELHGAPDQSLLALRPDQSTVGSLMQRTLDGSRVWLYQPKAERGELPLLIVLDGEVWVHNHNLPTGLDNLIADGLIPPIRAVFVDSGGTENRWHDLGSGDFGAAWLTETLLPWVRSVMPVTEDPAKIAVAGQSLGGLAALWTALSKPMVVGAAISQSPSVWMPGVAASFLALGDQDQPGEGVRLCIQVGAQEWVLREPTTQLAVRLAERGARLHFDEFNGGHDYACWRGGLIDGLRWVFGAAADSSDDRIVP